MRRKRRTPSTATTRRIPPVAKGVGDLEYARRKQRERQSGVQYLKPPPKRTANPGVTSKEGSTTTSRTRFDPKTGRRTTGTNTSGTSTGPNIVDPGSRKGLGTAIKKAKKKKKQRR